MQTHTFSQYLHLRLPRGWPAHHSALAPSSLSTSAARAFWFLDESSALSGVCSFSQLTAQRGRSKNCARVSISSGALVPNPSSYVSFVLRSYCAAVMLRLLRQNQSPGRPGDDQHKQLKGRNHSALHSVLSSTRHHCSLSADDS